MHDPIEKIEARLRLRLPDAYRRYLRVAVTKGAYASNQLFDDADEILVVTLRLRARPTPNDYPVWRESFVAIGDDGCGNTYFLDAHQGNEGNLQLFSHDPPGIELGEPAKPFFDDETQTCEALPDARSNCDWRNTFSGTFITRESLPWRSPLNPIRVDEWRDYIQSDSSLALGYTQHLTNPFTEESVEWVRPDSATWRPAAKEVEIAYRDGALWVRPASDAVKNKMQTIASALNAKVVVIPDRDES